MGLRRVFGIVFASLGFASLLLSILLFIYVTYAIIETNNILQGLAYLYSLFFWLVSTVLYLAGYLISLGVKSRLLAVLFTVGGAINLFAGSALTVFLTVFLLAQYGFNITIVSVIGSLLPLFLLLSIIILVGIAFILAGRRKL
jgi:hypothetical protein